MLDEQENHFPPKDEYTLSNGTGAATIFAMFKVAQMGLQSTCDEVIPRIQLAGIVPSRRPLEKATAPIQCEMV